MDFKMLVYRSGPYLLNRSWYRLQACSILGFYTVVPLKPDISIKSVNTVHRKGGCPQLAHDRPWSQFQESLQSIPRVHVCVHPQAPQ
jgi:hypothetical protein